MSERTIRVTGKGSVRVRPDTTRLTFDLEGTYPDYGEAMERSAERTEALKTALQPLGFTPDALKTLHFGVDAQYESHLEDGEYRQHFVGYRFHHTLKLEFPADGARLGQILCALAGSGADAQFAISYTVKDPDAVKNELLAKAVADARTKAELLAAAAGCALGELLTVDYSWGEVSFESRPMNGLFDTGLPLAKASAPALGRAMDVTPDDIETTDTVTVVWRLN